MKIAVPNAVSIKATASETLRYTDL